MPLLLYLHLAFPAHEPPDTEYQHGIGNHNNALPTCTYAQFGCTHDACQQHYVVGQSAEEEPKDVETRHFLAAIAYVERPATERQENDDGSKQAGVVAAKVDGLNDVGKTVDEFEQSHARCHTTVTTLYKDGHQRPYNPHQTEVTGQICKLADADTHKLVHERRKGEGLPYRSTPYSSILCNI